MERDLFGIKHRKYTHLAWCLLSIWFVNVSSFWGDFEVVVAAFYRRSQGCFPAEIRMRCSIFPTQRRVLHLSPFHVGLKKISSFLSNSNDFCFSNGAFYYAPHSAIILSTMAQFNEINISDRSSMTTATYQTGRIVERGLYF